MSRGHACRVRLNDLAAFAALIADLNSHEAIALGSLNAGLPDQAEMTGRVCHAVELSPAHVGVAVLRWQAFTGERATLDEEDIGFDAVAAFRLEGDGKS